MLDTKNKLNIDYVNKIAAANFDKEVDTALEEVRNYIINYATNPSNNINLPPSIPLKRCNVLSNEVMHNVASLIVGERRPPGYRKEISKEVMHNVATTISRELYEGGWVRLAYVYKEACYAAGAHLALVSV